MIYLASNLFHLWNTMLSLILSLRKGLMIPKNILKTLKKVDSEHYWQGKVPRVIDNVEASEPEWNCSIQNGCQALYLVNPKIPAILWSLDGLCWQDGCWCLRCLKENPSALRMRFSPDIWVFSSLLNISRRERAVARNSFGEMTAGSQVPAHIKVKGLNRLFYIPILWRMTALLPCVSLTGLQDMRCLCQTGPSFEGREASTHSTKSAQTSKLPWEAPKLPWYPS